MHAYRLLRHDPGMTTATVHRIESAPVSALVGTHVAVEAFFLPVHAACQLRQVDLVTVTTWIHVLGAGGGYPK